MSTAGSYDAAHNDGGIAAGDEWMAAGAAFSRNV